MENGELQEHVVDLRAQVSELQSRLQEAQQVQGQSASRFSEYVKVKRENVALQEQLSSMARGTLRAHKAGFTQASHGQAFRAPLPEQGRRSSPRLVAASPSLSASLDIATAVAGGSRGAFPPVSPHGATVARPS